MAREWFFEGRQVTEDGEEEYFIGGAQLGEDQAAAPPAGGAYPTPMLLGGVG